MLDAAREALSFATHRQRTDLEGDRMLALSLVKLIEIIGKAATGVSAETKEKYPQIPWRVTIAMRNRLIQGYFSPGRLVPAAKARFVPL